MTKKTLKIDQIVADPALNVRAGGVDKELAKQYAEILDQLPPVEIYEVNGENILVDGFHRLQAHVVRELDEIPANVETGKTRAQAEDRAAEANTKHGKPLTIDERHTAIRTLLRHKHSQSETARRLGVNQQLVNLLAKADKLQRKHGTEGLTMTHWREVGRLPDEQQKQFAETIRDQMWTRDEARIAVEAILDESRPKDYVERLLAGEADPIQVTNGQAAVSTDTVKRNVERSKGADFKAPVWNLLRASAVLDELVGDGGLDEKVAQAGFSADDLNRIEDELSSVAIQAAGLRKAVQKSRTLQSV